jgi:hypothetical protein
MVELGLMMEQILTDYSTSYGLNQILSSLFQRLWSGFTAKSQEAHEPEKPFI